MKTSRILTMLLLLFSACDPSIGRTYWIIGDSTALSIVEQLIFFSSLRSQGDLVIPIATVPGYTIGIHSCYYMGRIQNAMLPKEGLGIPNAVVIMLGTNDMANDAFYPYIETDEQLDLCIERLLGSIPNIPVLWVENSSHFISQERKDRLHNGLIRAQEKHPNLELMVPTSDIYAENDVHFTEAGTIDIGKKIVDRLDQIMTVH